MQEVSLIDPVVLDHQGEVDTYWRWIHSRIAWMKVEIYTKNWCVYCYRAKAMLEAEGIEYVEYDVTRDPDREAEMRERSGARTVPQIFIDDVPMGGSDDLSALIREGRLQTLLER